METQNCGYLLRLKHCELTSIVSVIQTLLNISQDLEDHEVTELSLKELLEEHEEDIAICRGLIYGLQLLPDGKLCP